MLGGVEMSKISRGSIRVQGFKNDEMDFQLIRQLGSASYGAASAGEVFSVVSRIKDETPENWVKAFRDLGQWQMKDGDERQVKGHYLSARDQWFKACNSFRAAEYFTPTLYPLHKTLGMQSRACFIKAIKYMPHVCEEVMLSYRGDDYPLYFMSPGNTGEKRKTLLIVSGFDGTTEEEYFMRGRAALERDYNVLLFTGPGQMDVFRFHQTHFEPDFENVVKHVLDFAFSKPEVDENKIGLMGISFGGYFATRAAAYEPRIKALIVNSPIVNLRNYLLAFQDSDLTTLPDSEDFTREDISHIPDSDMPPLIKEMCDALIVRFGQKTYKETFVYLQQFLVAKDAISNIRCPSLALVGKGEATEAENQFKAFSQGVSGPVTVHEFTDFEGAGTHCQVGNPSYSNAVALDWLDEQFAKCLKRDFNRE